MTTLKEIYQQHKGKVSDKWSLYLDSYDKILSHYRSQPINMLEIGVQNGGSLEIWAKYFPHAQHIIGCDIHPKCGELQYDDQRIQVIIGNAIHDITQQHIAQVSPNFDIIIDDGSHTSSDIIHTFARYFNQLNDGGIFIFEDLHCSYWQRYEGGLYHPHSAIAFFKNLIDIINYEHWGLPAERNEVLRDFYQTYHLHSIIDLDHIHSIEFINSMCVITKRSPIENELGTRLVVGDTAIVETQVIALNGSKSTPIDQSITPYRLSPPSQIKLLKEEILRLKTELSISEQNKQASQNQLQQFAQQHQNLLQQHSKYKKLWTISLFKPLVQTELAISSANRYRKLFRNLTVDKGSIGKAYQTLRRIYKNEGFKATKAFLRNQNTKISYIQDIKIDLNYQPKVSVIVPNYNHAAFLKDRLDSILNQSYKNIELIILDDRSKDCSIETIHTYFQNKDVPYKLIVNEQNSGNVFKQWKKGIEEATGDLIWICESDDSCELDFLSHIVPVFSNQSVNMAFGRIQFINSQGQFFEGLDAYRENAESNIWHSPCIRPAFQWFNGAFGINNVYANASGGVFKRQILADDIWNEACKFKICGDWYLYLHLAGAGQIAYIPTAVSYFRQHEKNTSASNFNKLYYYTEHFHVLTAIQQKWNISEKTRNRFIAAVKKQYLAFKMDKTNGVFEDVFSQELNTPSNKNSLHIQLYFLGFHPGGGELFPIVLANELHQIGHTVSMVALDLNIINQDMAKKLHPNIPVYHINNLTDSLFIANTGTDIIHTHIVGADRALVEFLEKNQIKVPYVVTMHGSHDRDFTDENIMKEIVKYVSKWVYIADRNLDSFQNIPIRKEMYEKFPNAMPIDNRLAHSSRESLGIKNDDVVFAFAARGIPEKGWSVLVKAFLMMQNKLSTKNIHLIMMGEGPAQIEAATLASTNPNIHFLGYESAVNGVLRYSDCLVLPTRFAGESYPLCLIQALQEKLPCITTHIGEVKNMIQNDRGELAGILVDNNPNDEQFIVSLALALEQMSSPTIRAKYQKVAQEISKNYDMRKLAERYIDLYREVIYNKNLSKFDIN